MAVDPSDLDFKRTAFLALGAALMSACVSLGNVKWRGYRSQALQFELLYPSDWQVQFESPSFRVASSTEEYVHGVGIPPRGAWVEVYKVTPEAAAACAERSEGFEPLDHPAGVLEKVVCLEDEQMALRVWESEPRLRRYKKLLDRIAQTFHPLKGQL